MNIIITAGGTAEPIDNVRKITNSSTGKLGVQITKDLLLNDKVNKIIYITSKHSFKPDYSDKLKIVIANSTEDVQSTLVKELSENEIDFVIHSMAISDYTTKAIIDIEKLSSELAKNLKNGNKDKSEIESLIKSSLNEPEYIIDRNAKVSSSNENMLISLTKTPKIINLIKEISPNVKLIGFKLLSNVNLIDLEIAAKKVIENSKADYVLANDLKEIKEGKHIGYLISNKKISYNKTESIGTNVYPKAENKKEISELINHIISNN